VRVLGVDVSLGHGLDVALMEGSAVKDTWSRIGPDGLQRLLGEQSPDAVAIDSPPGPGLGLLREHAERLRLPVPPRPGTHVARRVAEYELSRRGIGSLQTHYDESRLFSWMTAGFEAFRAAGDAGYPLYLGQGRARGRAFEVFPYASYVALAGCLSPGRRNRPGWRRSVLAEAAVSGVPEGATIDVVDAACAALTGIRFLEECGSFVGDSREGVIVLPVPALQDRYRRCASPGGAKASPVAHLCECGCGAAVSRRFLPGHDAILRGRLIKAAREGAAARRELDRLGWSHLMREG
jgi:Protein of unknown function (DUF429)